MPTETNASVCLQLTIPKAGPLLWVGGGAASEGWCQEAFEAEGVRVRWKAGGMRFWGLRQSPGMPWNVGVSGFLISHTPQ